MLYHLQAEALMKAYPPFVNFFEQTKETIAQCDKSKPRFHAFLKVCQSKPECGRQTLQELLIRPVQRLPSILLLLKGLWVKGSDSGLILDLRPANERRRYKVTPSLIGRAQT